MKNTFTIILSAITATLVTLLFQKVTQSTPQPAAQSPAPPKSRKIEEIAPSFTALDRDFGRGDEWYEDHHTAWIAFVREAVQPGLTELEADQVAQAIFEYMPPPYNYFDPAFPPAEKYGTGEGDDQ
jgi:hypothetical protein